MRLTTAAALFVGANVLHSLDHARQGFDRLDVEIIAAAALLAVAGARGLPRRQTA